jgi:hypothetical protein
VAKRVDADHVAAHSDLLQRPVNVGKEVGQIDDQTAQLRALKALLGDHIADAVELTQRADRRVEHRRRGAERGFPSCRTPGG